MEKSLHIEDHSSKERVKQAHKKWESQIPKYIKSYWISDLNSSVKTYFIGITIRIHLYIFIDSQFLSH